MSVAAGPRPWPRPARRPRIPDRLIALAMAVEAASLAAMSALHLSGALDGGSPPYRPRGAGVAEAVIAVVLIAGAIALARRTPRARTAAAAALGFAILGFVIGLGFTVQGGRPIDVAYHATVLPLLVLTLAALSRSGPRRPGPRSS